MRLAPYLAGLLLLLLGACGDDGQAESQLRAWVAAAEVAVESRSLQQVSTLISPAYRDNKGHNRADLGRLLQGYFQRHRQIHLLTRIASVLPDESGNSGRVTVFVAMAGVPVASPSDLAGLRADYYRFDLLLEKEGGQWRLIHANWRRATLGDLLSD